MSDVISEIDEEYDNILKQLGCRFGESLYAIPSSTHEFIILPKSEVKSEADLKEMICEINRTIVDPDEVLADHPYYYDLQKETLGLAACCINVFKLAGK